MSEVFSKWPLWLTVTVILLGLPLVTTALQAVIRRRFPTLAKRQHNDVAGFLIAVVGVIYAVTVGFIISNQWENYTQARQDTYDEAFTLAGVAEGSTVLGPATHAELTKGVIEYNEAVLAWWPRSGQTPSPFDPREDATLSRLLQVLSDANPTTQAQKSFVAQATTDVVTVDAQNDARLHQSSRAHLEEPLWVIILISSGVTTVFCLLFGLENQFLHYLMVAAVSLAIATNIALVVLLNHPLSGVMPVSPDAYESVLTDLRAGG